jgi:hypothetical protein
MADPATPEQPQQTPPATPPADAPAASPSGEASAPQSATPPSSGVDWRLVAIIGVAALFLIAAFVNKKYYSDKKISAVTTTTAPAEAATPRAPRSPQEESASLVRRREIEAMMMAFTVGEKVYLLADAPAPVAADGGKTLAGARPGRLFDVTRRAGGVGPEMFARRGVFGTQAMAFMDTYPPLGCAAEMQMAQAVFKPAAEVAMDVLTDQQLVIGLKVGEQARAYPMKIANWHDVVNDVVGGVPVAVVWSAHANCAVALDRRLPDGTTAVFGSSGLIFQMGAVVYDRATASLWSPTRHECVAGPLTGTKLNALSCVMTDWKSWRTMHPATTALVGAQPPAQGVNYEQDPVLPADYLRNTFIFFPVYGVDVANTPMRFKSIVFGVTGPDGKAVKAYEAGLLVKEKTWPLEDTISGRKVALQFDPQNGILTATAEGKPLLVERMLWICWAGTHQATEVWQEDALRAALRPGASATTTTLPVGQSPLILTPPKP